MQHDGKHCDKAGSHFHLQDDDIGYHVAHTPPELPAGW